MMFFPFEANVVGVSWHQDNIAGISAGDTVEVHAEPGNEYDSGALVVLVGGRKVGYLARAVSRKLAENKIYDLIGVVASRGVARGRGVQGVRVLLEPSGATNLVGNRPPGGDGDAVLTTPVVPPPTAGRTVRVRGSGRVVGTLLSQDRERGRVVVAGPRGTVEYGDELVIIDELVSS